MAFKPLFHNHARSIGNHEMLPEEFQKWLENFDSNKDGKITVEELQEAIHASGRGWFSKWKAKHALKLADKNSDGVLDKNEIKNLVEIAQKYMGVVIVED